MAASKVGKAVLLNHSTDGVSCETTWNVTTTLNYLSGKINHISFPDTNHNVKNCRYQLVGGSCAAAIGFYCFDPWLLKMSGVAKELIWVEDFASDAVVLRLASASTVKKMISLDPPDIGNHAVTIMSLVFMRLRSYAINSRTAGWRERASYSWASLLWFTSFHSCANTMLTNKRNMLLESVGTIFLVTRSDVHNLRRVTSEANEHTFGGWRSVNREFDIAKLVGIEEKCRNYTNAIFEGGLKTCRSGGSEFKGYQETFSEYAENVQKSLSSSSGGAVDVCSEKQVSLCLVTSLVCIGCVFVCCLSWDQQT